MDPQRQALKDKALRRAEDSRRKAKLLELRAERRRESGQDLGPWILTQISIHHLHVGIHTRFAAFIDRHPSQP